MRKIQQLHSYFQQDLIVVTDEENIRNDWILPTTQIVSPTTVNVTLTSKLNLNFRKLCCGIERTIMWLIQNQHSYDYAWVMEDDVHWSNFGDFQDFFESYRNDTTDLLHSNAGMEQEPLNDTTSRWWGIQRLRPPFVAEPAAFQNPPYYKGLFQFYRLSSHFVAALDNWRVQYNRGEWTFFEGLFANLAHFPFNNNNNNNNNDTDSRRRNQHQQQLTTKSFIHNSIGYEFHFQWRPCFSYEHVENNSNNKNGHGRGGLFHPVKKDAYSENCRLKPKTKL
jgi:hypothetical protein